MIRSLASMSRVYAGLSDIYGNNALGMLILRKECIII